MPKDYAKQGHHAHRRHSSNANAPGYLWLVAGILVVLFAATLFYLKQHSLSTAKPTITGDNKNKASTPPVPKQPRFDFYTLLPQNKIAISQPENLTKLPKGEKTAPETEAVANVDAEPEQSIEKTTPVKSAVSKPVTPTSKDQYFLAIAAYKRYADADQLKAQLSLLGFDVSITPIKRQGDTLNRVWLGPYNTHATAEKERLRLLNYHIKGVLLKQKNG